jgi:AcrR family transcriptional regulator
MGKQSGRVPLAPSVRALRACVEAALRTGGRPLSITDYAEETGISARMLIHHFGSKENLDHAVIRAVDDQLRARAESLAQARGGLEAIDQLVLGLKSARSAQLRRLFRTLLAKAFEADPVAVGILLEERERWTTLFEAALKSRVAASEAVTRLLGATIDAILEDMATEAAVSRRPPRSPRRVSRSAQR